MQFRFIAANWLNAMLIDILNEKKGKMGRFIFFTSVLNNTIWSI